MTGNGVRECMNTANDLLPWYLNGTLQSTERAQVEAHLGDCPVCRRELAELSELAEALDLHAESDQRPDARKPARASFPAALGWAAAASVVLIASLAVVVMLRRAPAPPPSGLEAGESMSLDLGSGPTRSADSPAELRISGKTRRVELSFAPPIDGRNDFEVRLTGPDHAEVQSWDRGPLDLDPLGRARLSVEAGRLARDGDYQLLVRHFGESGESREYAFPFLVATASK